jgi:hypothetical protein
MTQVRRNPATELVGRESLRPAAGEGRCAALSVAFRAHPDGPGLRTAKPKDSVCTYRRSHVEVLRKSARSAAAANVSGSPVPPRASKRLLTTRYAAARAGMHVYRYALTRGGVLVHEPQPHTGNNRHDDAGDRVDPRCGRVDGRNLRVLQPAWRVQLVLCARDGAVRTATIMPFWIKQQTPVYAARGRTPVQRARL